MKKVSEERILQICNDIAEGIDNHPKKRELVACITYWQDHNMKAAERECRLKSKLILVATEHYAELTGLL